MAKPILTEQDFQRSAKKLRCEVPAIKAVAEVESRGKGFYANGLDMLPQFTRHNIFDSPTVHSETFCQSQPFFTLFSQCTNFYHLVYRQFRSSVFFAVFIHYCQMMVRSFIGMTFRIPIAVVVQMRAKKQVVGIATGTVVARMANQRLVGIDTIMQKICNTMSKPRMVFIPKLSITRGAVPACPQPTGISFVDIFMKSNYVFGG